MSTSHLTGEILFTASALGETAPVDSAFVRDELIGSALHKADMAGQHVMTWVAPSATYFSGNADPHIGLSDGVSAFGDLVADAWYIYPVQALYVPKVHASRQGYSMRVRVAGRSSAGDSVDFGIAVGLSGPAGIQEYFGDVPSGAVKTFSGVTSTTAAWLTPDDASNVITVPVELIDAAQSMGEWSTKTDIGGAPISMSMPLLVVVPFARTSDPASQPLLHGVIAHEVVGV